MEYNELRDRIIAYVTDDQPEMYWSNDSVDDGTVKELLTKGKELFLEELWDMNIEAVSALEAGVVEAVTDEFAEDIEEVGMSEEALQDLVYDHVCVSLNEKDLFNQFRDIDVVLMGCRNTDCCNSTDDPDSSNRERYVGDIYYEIMRGVRRRDFIHEFRNGAYGGALFMFGFRMSVLKLLQLKEEMKTGTHIRIPKDTAFGFHSMGAGASSIFETKTHRTMTIPIYGESPEYDRWVLCADMENSYSIADVYGQEIEFPEGDPKIITKGGYMSFYTTRLGDLLPPPKLTL